MCVHYACVCACVPACVGYGVMLRQKIGQLKTTTAAKMR